LCSDRERKVVLETKVRPNGKQEFHAVFWRLDGPVKVTFQCGLNWGRFFDILQALPMVSDVVLANAFQTRIIAEAQERIQRDRKPQHPITPFPPADPLSGGSHPLGILPHPLT
jgi:hypothetical protein